MADTQSNADSPARPELPPDAPRAGVLHVRHRHTERYTVVGNHLAQHPRLSAAAIGIGVHIQSLPDGASVTIKALTLRFSEGERRIGKALKELEAAGYLVRRKVPLGGGRIATRTFFLECPGAVPVSAKGSGAPAAASDPGPGAGAGAGGEPPEPVSVPVSAEVPATVPEPAPGPAEALPSDTAPTPVPAPPVAVESGTGLTGPAADLLARLRLADPRLLLSVRDVQRLVPAVETWLARSATSDQITRTLTAGLPSEAVAIHHPARLLEYRLSTLLPPPLPTAPPPGAGRSTAPPGPAPMVNCDGCDRGFRTHDPHARCRDCRERGTAAVNPAA